MTISNVSNQLIVPVTLWGSKSPTHCVSSLILTNDYRTIITGCNDGQICVWDLSEDKKSLVPRSLLFGHSAAVLCLSNGKQEGDVSQFVSSSESGEMSLWDLNDGRCMETIKLHYIHTNITTFSGENNILRYFCNGYYAEILVINGLTLEIMYTLNSKLSPDWISAIHVLKPTKSQGFSSEIKEVVIGLSIAGIMKVWTLIGKEAPTSIPFYENESKPIRCLNALHITCCFYNQRTLLIVCAKYWQIYDVGDFALLCSVENRRGERWSGGEFLSADRVIIWSDVGKSYLYKLPIHCLTDNQEFRKPNTSNLPYLYATLCIPNDKRLLCPPAMAFYNLGTLDIDELALAVQIPKVVIRGDSYGTVSLWTIPDVCNWDLIGDKVPEIAPTMQSSLSNAWKSMQASPCGIIDTLLKSIDDQPHSSSHSHSKSHSSSCESYKLTSSVYIPALGRLVCGREDGSIIIVSANQTIMLQLLLGRHLTYEDWPHHQILFGHSGRVNTLLYPHQLEDRYEIAHLVSGGVDFSVCLWDIFTGALLHRFSVHAGEITQMFAPPKDCSPRILNCICSVASDHSVALISLKERKCVMLASRHLFPISTIKWRPLDDFMIVGCIDGSIYVWQMETGHLDRMLHGMAAEEILNACDGNTSMNTSGDRFVNPALHLFRGLRHRNLAAIKQAAVRGLHNISAHLQQQRLDVIDASIRSRSNPLLIQGLRTNQKDQESHILFFDVEALIVQLLSEEYDQLSPNTLESRGLTSNLEYKRYTEMASSPETQHKFSGLLAKMKDTAENAAQKIQAKAESVGFKNVHGDISVGFHRKTSTASNATDDASSASGGRSNSLQGKLAGDSSFTSEIHMPMEIARLLMSLLHAWGLDPDLDRVCEMKLGLLRPLRPVCFGQISKGGHMSLLLPTYLNRLDEQLKSKLVKSSKPESGKTSVSRTKPDRHVKIVSTLPSNIQMEEEMAQRFTSKLHWEFSSALSTNHLMSLLAMTNTMITMQNGTTFISSSFAETNRRRLIRKLSRQSSQTTVPSSGAIVPTPPSTLMNDDDNSKQSPENKKQIRDGWAVLGALHCCLLGELIKSENFKRPMIEILARRWQDRCIEIREAAQGLLISELRLAGSKGRRAIVEEWQAHLPNYTESIPDANATQNAHSNSSGGVGGGVPIPSVGGHRSSTTIHHNSQPHSMSNSPIPSPISDSNNIPMNPENNNTNIGSDGEQEDEDEDEMQAHLTSSIKTANMTSGSEGRRRQATAIILMGVIGSEYGSEITGIESSSSSNTSKSTPPPRPPRPGEANGNVPKKLEIPLTHAAGRRKSLIEGFGGAGNYSLARKTSKALAYLLLAPPTPSLPYHTSLRRAAIDLIGRGFTVWEPYIDVSKILMALLEFCSAEGEPTIVPSQQFGLPLTPVADSSRTARAAIHSITEVRPSVFITTLAREVTRYNTMQQQQQSLNFIPNQTVLYRARPEILKNLEYLIEKKQSIVYDLIIETTDIILYCLDQNALKTRGLGELFPTICRFQNVTYCTSSKRVAVGASNGNLAIYELKTGKSQLIAAHSGHPITACAFAPDGKHLASYCAEENRVSFWLTAVGLFGLGKSQTQCVKWHQSPPMPETVRQLGLIKSAKLVWVSSKLLILLFANGKEHRFTV